MNNRTYHFVVKAKEDDSGVLCDVERLENLREIEIDQIRLKWADLWLIRRRPSHGCWMLGVDANGFISPHEGCTRMILKEIASYNKSRERAYQEQAREVSDGV